jgi:hypothetical protein
VTLLERVKERVETDLGDKELEALIAEAQSDIRNRYGADRDTEAPITVEMHGETRALDLLRPLDTTEAIKVVEEVDTRYGISITELAADDYRVWNGGRTLQRLVTGTNARRYWGQRVEVTYVPQDDQATRDEVTVRAVKLAIEHQAVSSQKVGDVQTSHLDYSSEREKIITDAAPRKGLMIV